jgi:hypothetical protein
MGQQHGCVVQQLARLAVQQKFEGDLNSAADSWYVAAAITMGVQQPMSPSCVSATAVL